jgi:hypothetical protein
VKRLFLVLILASSLLTMACTGATVKRLGELQNLQAELTKKFGDEVSLNLTGEILYVAIINSRLNFDSPQQRAKRAEETAQIINAHYANSTLVTAIYVTFLLQRTRFLVIHQTLPVDEYGFARNGQQLRPLAGYWPAPLPDSEVAVGHSSDGTDVSPATTFQIAEEPGGYGITLLPHFRLPEEARGIKAPPPEQASFYFSSYSKKPRFSKPVPVEFIVDGMPVMQEEATFVGNDAQYCDVKVSYPVFHKVANAKAATIKLGAKEYPLTPKQLEILRKMDGYVLQ